MSPEVSSDVLVKELDSLAFKFEHQTSYDFPIDSETIQDFELLFKMGIEILLSRLQKNREKGVSHMEFFQEVRQIQIALNGANFDVTELQKKLESIKPS